MTLSVAFVALFRMSCISADGQNLIGYSETEIRKFMKENHKEMICNDVRNSMYKYLKYSDESESQTLLFFLSDDSVCKNIRLVCDRSLIEEKIKELNSLYKKSGVNKWIDRHNGKKYIVELNDEKWAFTITFRQNDK
jgi:hypothetical protein